MVFGFIPNLKHMAIVKVTAEVCEHSDIHPFTLHTFIFDESKEEDFEKKVTERLQYLPIGLQKFGLTCVKTLCWHIMSWRRNHNRILGSAIEKRINFKWRSDGTIDNAKTAEALLGDDGIENAPKFYLACCYFLKEYLMDFWRNLQVNERNTLIQRTQNNRAVSVFWIPWLESGTSAEFLAEFTPTDLSENEFLLSLVNAKISLRSFIENLPMIKCLYWLRKISKLHLLNNDLLHFLVSGPLRSQQMTVFCENAYLVLKCFLSSPFQNMFSEVVENLWEYLSAEEFCAVINDICFKIEGRREDFDYLKLLEQFWTKSPLPYKEFLQEKLNNNTLVNYGIIAKHLSKIF